jgi:hypothetical protein
MSDYGNAADEAFGNTLKLNGYDDDDVAEMRRRPSEIAYLPSFAYNAYYIGGWWRTEFVDGNFIQRPQYADRNVVVRSPSGIRNSSQMVVFCSAAQRTAGSYSELRNDEPGSHYVVPPILANERVWQIDQEIGSPEIIEGLDTQPVPLGRYTGGVSVLYADLRVTAVEPGDLDDQRMWINRADERDESHAP